MMTPRPPLRIILRVFWLSVQTRSMLDDTFLIAALRYSATAEELWAATEAARTAEPHDQDAANAEVLYAAAQHKKSISWYDQVEDERKHRDQQDEERWREQDRRDAAILPFIPADRRLDGRLDPAYKRPGAAPVPPADPDTGDTPQGSRPRNPKA